MKIWFPTWVKLRWIVGTASQISDLSPPLPDLGAVMLRETVKR